VGAHDVRGGHPHHLRAGCVRRASPAGCGLSCAGRPGLAARRRAPAVS
jgi:hypothetical protein